MRTTYPHTGFRETPPDLLERFGARLSVFGALAWATIEVERLGRMTGVTVQPECSRDLALALRELHDDYEDLREALMTWEWSDPEPEVQAVIA